MSYCVFFDLDETIIKKKSMLEVIKIYYKENYLSFIDLEKSLLQYKSNNKNRSDLNSFFYSQFRGISVRKMCKVSQEWFVDNINTIFNSFILSEIKKHQELGADIFIVSGSFFECVEPIANHLNINHVICTKLEQEIGIYTGKMLSDPVIGKGKELAILNYIKNHKFSLKNSYAYGDHSSDIYMLSLVENPIVVGANQKLLKYARKEGWLIA